MISSKNNASYNMLISLCNKTTCLNSVITPEAIDRLKDELGGIFTLQKHTTMSKVKSMDTLPASSPSQSTGWSLKTQRGPTLCL
jgi:hypothetical protein